MIIFAIRACKTFDRRQITKLYTNSDDFALTVRYHSLKKAPFGAKLIKLWIQYYYYNLKVNVYHLKPTYLKSEIDILLN